MEDKEQGGVEGWEREREETRDREREWDDGDARKGLSGRAEVSEFWGEREREVSNLSTHVEPSYLGLFFI